MYLQYFGFHEAPFSITPDPAFVYLSAAHRDALAHLLYGVGQGGASGFVQLTGEVGTGKTTMCRCLLEQVPEQTRVALILNPLQTPRELLASICEELGLDVEPIRDSSKAMVDRLNQFLLDQHGKGRRVVVVIDEAQNLSPEALEQVRLLTNLETAKDKLLQMVLLGQPELRQLLQRQNLRQLAQRITARYHLAPLNAEETEAYVAHRIKVAGAQRNPFKKSAIRAIYQRSGGVPRLINIIADRALAGAYAREAGQVTARFVHDAANEVQPSEQRVSSNRWPAWIAAFSALALVAVSFLVWQSLDRPSLTRPEPAPTMAQETEPKPDAMPQPATVVEVVPEPGLTPDWLIDQHRVAWSALANEWQDPGAEARIQQACDGVEGTGYACLREQGNWSRIRQLGLPVLLVLQGDTPLMLPLRGLAGERVLVGAAGDERSVDPDQVERRWFGEYLVVWPQAPGWPSEIRRGESGEAVDIVMAMAAYAEPPWQGSGVFDAQFETWLKAFQQRHGLEADGIVGPNTLIYLMAPTIDRPRLRLESQGSS